MSIIDFLYAFVYVFPKSLIMTHEIFPPRGDPRSSSGWAADLPFQESKAQPYLQGLDQTPCLAVRHTHLTGCSVEGHHFFYSSQELIRTVSKGFSMVIQPDLVTDLHGFTSIVILF
jgi:hypothetical protein